MRESKFRAWDKEHNKMWFTGQEGESIGDWTFQTYFNKQGCLEAVIYRCFDNGIGLESQDIKLPIMQDTGMRDKNGTKIYDGDILCCKCKKRGYLYLKDDEEIFEYKNNVIEWWQSYCNLGYRLKDSEGHTLMIKPTHLKTMEVEVIGSIYENPELLKG